MSKKRRLTRKEKIELYGEKEEDTITISQDNILQDNEIMPISPESLLIEDKDVIKKITIYEEYDAWRDDFKPPSRYYFIYCTGHHIFLRTRDRHKAQEICDIISGKKGFYGVKSVITAQVR